MSEPAGCASRQATSASVSCAASAAASHSGWPLTRSELLPYYERAEAALGNGDAITDLGALYANGQGGLLDVANKICDLYIDGGLIGGAALKGATKAVDVGPVWLIAELAEIEALENLHHDPARLTAYYEQYGLTGATLFAAHGERVVVRSFAPGDGIPEDPVCGSGNGAVAAYRLALGQVNDGSAYRASQGRQLGRDGWIDIRIEGSDIHVGGECVTCVRGEVQL